MNRIGDRLRLLTLPAVWWPKIATGELTLGFAADIAKANPDVQTVLAARGEVPTAYQLGDTIKDHRHHQASLDMKEACTTRDLVVSTKDKYDMAKTHVEVASCTPKQLAKVLLPAVHGSHPPLHVTLSGKWENPPKVTVWQVRTIRPSDQVDSNKTPFQLWTEQCQAIQTAHVAAIADYDARLAAALVDHCLTLDTKDVAQAAMHYQIKVAFKDRSVPALKLGWVKPTRVDKATVEATLDEWYSHARNFAAAVAYALLARSAFTPPAFEAQWDQTSDSVVGPRPVRPENPPSPTIPPHDDEDEPDENAHLAAIDDSDGADFDLNDMDPNDFDPEMVDDVDGDSFGVDA